jgi:hypothetical protein
MSVVSTAISTAIAPFTHYIYAGIIGALLVGFGWYTLHERGVQHDKDVAAQLQEIQVVVKHDVEIEQTADAVVAKAETTHEELTSAPPVANLGLVCRDANPDPVPAAAAGNASGAVQGEPVPGDVFDPSGDLLTQSRLYEATIGELQVTIAALRAEMLAASASHQVKP